jgi:hypothetical protein
MKDLPDYTDFTHFPFIEKEQKNNIFTFTEENKKIKMDTQRGKSQSRRRQQ